MRDDLFVATIPPMPEPEHPPWPVGSTVYPAAFGGAVAAAIILIGNGGRLGVGAAHRVMVGAVAAVICRLWLLRSGPDLAGLYGITTAAEGIAVYLTAAPAHRRTYRAYLLRAHAPTSSLTGPGVLAVVLGLVVEGVLAVFVLASA